MKLQPRKVGHVFTLKVFQVFLCFFFHCCCLAGQVIETIFDAICMCNKMLEQNPDIPVLIHGENMLN